MGQILDIREYVKQQRAYRTVKVDTVKNFIKNEKIGDFFGITEEEEEKYYEDLTDALNDVVEKPSGEVAYTLGNLLSERKIKSFDFDRIFELIKNAKIEENMQGETETKAEIEENPIIETEYENVYIDLDEFQDIFNDEKSDEEFLSELSETLSKITDDMIIIPQEQENTSNKASTPFKVIGDISKGINQVIKSLKDNFKFKSTSPKTATTLASIFGQAQTLEDESEEIKPTVKSTPKKVKINGKAKKGTTKTLKEKINKNKTLKARNSIEKAKEFSELILNSSKENAQNSQIDLEEIKDKKLKSSLSNLRGGNIDLNKVEALKEEVKIKRDSQIAYLRNALDNIQTCVVKADLSRETDLTEEQINKLIYGVDADLATKAVSAGTWKTKSFLGLNTDGALQIDPKSGLKLEDVKGKPLEEELRRLAAMPRVQDLTDEEVLQLAKSVKIQDGKIRVNFSYLHDGKVPGDLSWIGEDVVTMLPNGAENPEEAKEIKKDFEKYWPGKLKQGTRLQYFKNMYGNMLYVRGMESFIPEANKGFEEIGTYDKILTELDCLVELSKAQDFDKQISSMEDRLEEIDDKRTLSKKDKKDRKALRKIAESKVAELDEQGVRIEDEINDDQIIGKRLMVVSEEKLGIKGLLEEMGKSFGLVKEEKNVDMDKVIDTNKDKLDKTLSEK